MQTIILAAGQSSRMYPFAADVHKSMINMMGKPILFYTIEALKKDGIIDLIIVVNEKNDVSKYFGNGEKFGVNIQYVIQSNPNGMGYALLLCEENIKEVFLLLNASHVEVDLFAKDMINAKVTNVKAVLLANRKKDSVVQGSLKFEGKRVEGIIEKPKKGEEPSDMCVVGIYLLGKDFLNALKNTPQEHYRLEKAISDYSKQNNVTFVETSKETVSLKYPWDLLGIENYLLKNVKSSIGKNVKIAKSAEITGEVFIGDNVSIMEKAVIKGPAFIGNNVFIGNNAVLRGGVDVEEDAVIGANMEIKNVLIMKGSTTHSGYIGDSVIGKDCRIAAQFCTANVRLDRGIIASIVKDEETPTGCKYLGVIVGENTDIGIKCSTMPGIIIGNNVTVGPSTVVLHNVENNTKYYTKFQEVISKKK